MAEIVMPRLSDSMEEGTILQWLKAVGERVEVGDELVEIETDKANMAYESDVAGTLVEILAQEGETLPIGTTIARIGDSAEFPTAQDAGPVGAGDPPPPAVAKASSGVGPPTPPPASQAVEATAEGPSRVGNVQPQASGAAADEGPARHGDSSDGGQRVKASPIARRLAKDAGIDLPQLAGSGPGGRILKTDVESAVSAGAAPAVTGPPAQSPAAETAKGTVSHEDLSKLQSTVSRRMAESKATAPHFYLEAEVDMSRAVEARGKVKEIAAEGLVVPSYNDMVVKAAALALREYPRANGAYRDGRFELYSRVNVGIAVSARDALVVPTVFDADRKGLWQIGTEARELSQRVRDGSITPPELSGATFTVSNLGMFGIDSFEAVINPPQAAILAVGAIRERAVVRDGGQLGTAHLMRVNLACDHRILYGAQGAEFLGRIRDLLEEPFSLAL
jgi:pyruvate dehydrogenase E2 component (dihydrolipoamide acetyltransferase)